MNKKDEILTKRLNQIMIARHGNEMRNLERMKFIRNALMGSKSRFYKDIIKRIVTTEKTLSEARAAIKSEIDNQY